MVIKITFSQPVKVLEKKQSKPKWLEKPWKIEKLKSKVLDMTCVFFGFFSF